MGEYYTTLLSKVNEKFGEDKDVQTLIKCFKQELDDEGDRGRFNAKKVEDMLNGQLGEKSFLRYVRDNMHRYLQSEYINLICHSISVLGGDKVYTDGRNEGAVKVMRRIKEMCKENDISLGDYYLNIDDDKRW